MFWSGRRTRSIMAAHYRITIYKNKLALLRAEAIPRISKKFNEII
jgi:hypothetical protein